ncbi:hypothetical protein E4U41_003380, partial [Claviceps citrina]
MYASRSVCSRRALGLRLAVAPTATTTLRRGTAASSTSPAADSELEQETTTYAHKQPDGGGSRRKETSSSFRKPAHPPPFRRPPRQKLDQSSSARASFNDVMQRPGASTAKPPQYQVSESTLRELKVAKQMKEISDMAVEPLRKLQLFQENVWGQIKELPGGTLPKHIYMSATKFLAEMCDAVARQGFTRVSLALSQMLAAMGKFDTDVRNKLVLNLCHVLISRKNSWAERQAIRGELLDMWKHLSQLKRPSNIRPSRLEFVLPAAQEIMEEIMAAALPSRRRGDPPDQLRPLFAPTTRALASLFPQFRLEQAGELVPGLLATLAVLSDARLGRESLQIEAAPLLALVALALENQPADETYMADAIGRSRFDAAKLAQLQSYVAAQWPHVTEMLHSKDSAWRLVQSNPRAHKVMPSFPHSRSRHSSSRHSSSPPAPAVDHLHNQMRAAYKHRNATAVTSIWQDLTVQLADNADLGRQLREQPEFLDYCVFVWCALRRPHQIQETLEFMRRINVQPTVRTYTGMMHGWKVRNDVKRIEALWQKLVESGLKLDRFIWTERISGLIEAGRLQAGIHALAEMQGLWKTALAARAGDVEAAAAVAIQPTIEVVNAAFKGLLALDRRAAHELLAWAGREGIEPNIRTYNILLQYSFRSGGGGGGGGGDTTSEVGSILKTMKAQGVEPDEATFTIILEELLGGLYGASAAEQVRVVEQILDDMRLAGLKPNRETYAKMLHAVSSLPYGGADAAITAVQQHMRADGLTPSPHMVTILIERALSRDPLP